MLLINTKFKLNLYSFSGTIPSNFGKDFPEILNEVLSNNSHQQQLPDSIESGSTPNKIYKDHAMEG